MLRVEGTDFARVGSELERAGREIPSRFRSDLYSRCARPVADRMKRAVLGVSMSATQHDGSAVGRAGSTGGGLRAAIASAVNVYGSSDGAMIRVDTGALGDRRNIPVAMDRSGSWSHPVFGGPASVRQTASPAGWFRRTALESVGLVVKIQFSRRNDDLQALAGRL